MPIAKDGPCLPLASRGQFRHATTSPAAKRRWGVT